MRLLVNSQFLKGRGHLGLVWSELSWPRMLVSRRGQLKENGQFSYCPLYVMYVELVRDGSVITSSKLTA